MKKLFKQTGASDAPNRLRNFAVSAAEQMYQYYTAADDRLEAFRQAVFGMLEIRQHAEAAEKKYYAFCDVLDDSTEPFRQDIMEMVSGVLMIGSLFAHRFHQAFRRMRGLKKGSGAAVVDRKFENHVSYVAERLRSGQLGGLFETLEQWSDQWKLFKYECSVRIHRMNKKTEAKIDALFEHFLENRTRWMKVAAVSTGCLMLFCVTVNAGTVYNYYYHGTELGTVKDKAEVETAVEQLKVEVPEELNTEVAVQAEPDVDITYEKEFSFSAVVDTAEDIADKLSGNDELEGSGYAIRVNDTLVALVDTEETANRIMETVKKHYCTVNETQEEMLRNASIFRKAAAGDLNGDKTESTAAEELTASFDFSAVDYSQLDPSVLQGIASDQVEITDEVQIEPVTAKVSDFHDYDSIIGIFVDEDGASRIFNVSTTEMELYEDMVPFETEYENSSTMYQGQERVKVIGINGTKRVLANVTKVNGEETARQVIYEEIEVEPQSQLMLVGTKEKPVCAATGVFIKPASGKFSSGFGSRWGRKHEGIDIAGSYGSNVVAADGGTVIFSGYNSSGYGNLIKIDHGNGYVTYYGHNSENCVSVGEKVYQGQVIAKMGSTGRSTGNHCHFEIRKNGTPLDPEDYVGL